MGCMSSREIYKAVWQHSILNLVLSPSACHSFCRQFGSEWRQHTALVSLAGDGAWRPHMAVAERGEEEEPHCFLVAQKCVFEM